MFSLIPCLVLLISCTGAVVRLIQPQSLNGSTEITVILSSYAGLDLLENFGHLLPPNSDEAWTGFISPANKHVDVFEEQMELFWKTLAHDIKANQLEGTVDFIVYGSAYSLALQKYLQLHGGVVERPGLSLRVRDLVILGHSLHLDIPSSVNVLSLGGDVDGVSRVMSMALDFDREQHRRILYQHISVTRDRQPCGSSRNWDVYNVNDSLYREFIVLRGFSHLSFINGTVNQILRVDNEAEVDQAQSVQFIRRLLAEFRRDKQSLVLKKYTTATKEFLLPIIKVLFVEGHPGLLPPCSHFSDANPGEVDQNECFMGSVWTERVQAFISGMVGGNVDEWVREDATKASEWLQTRQRTQNEGTAFNMEFKGKNIAVRSFNEFHNVWVHFPLHLPSVTAYDSSTKNSPSLKMESVCENSYERSLYTRYSDCVADNLYGSDVGYKDFEQSSIIKKVATDFVKGKMFSQQVAQLTAGFNVTFDETDEKGGPKGGVGESLCAKSNELAEKYAELLIKDTTYQSTANKEYLPSLSRAYDRYLDHGVKMVFGKDFRTFRTIAPLWIWGKPVRKLKDNGRIMEVSGQALMTPKPYVIDLAAGLHFCQILTPASIMEWILTDSLPKRRKSN